MPGSSQVPDHRGAGDTGPPPARPRRSSPLAAPAAAGVAAALASVLATSLDVWDLPTSAKVAVTACAGLLVGLLTWATADRRPTATAVESGASWRPPDQWPPVPAHFTGRRES